MGGKRVAAAEAGAEQKQKKTHKAAWITLAVIAALLVGGAAGLCVWANGYSGVFPGVTIADIPLENQSLEQAEATLEAGLMERVDTGSVTVTASPSWIPSKPPSHSSRR